MDIKQLRQLAQEHGVVVLVEEGHTPLIVRECEPPRREVAEEVPIAARWPKGPPTERQPARPDGRTGGDAVLERLNKEILTLKEQIAQEEAR